MKTAILNADGVVVNVGMGEPLSSAPAGLTYVVVADDVWVGPGCMQAADGSFYDPNSPEQENEF
jgi:hypothetical protein